MVAIILCSSLCLYAVGIARLWRHAGAGQGIRYAQALAFIGGWFALVAALVWLDELSEQLFSAHMVQHLSFFGSAALFWWGLAHGRYGRLGYGAAVLYVFATAVHSGVLGALLTFSPRVWYPLYESTASRFGMTPLEDQQLAGLLMWVPASLVFIAGGLYFFAAWIRESERRAQIFATR